MPAELFIEIDRYIDGLFAPQDTALEAALADAKAAGLPQIQVSAGQGKLLYLFAKLVGARRILEIGTLAGYSTIWLARALAADGQLVTLEYEPRHAKVARANLERAGVGDKVEIVVGPALETLPGVLAKADAPFDLAFVDADKNNYPNYLPLVVGGLRSGGLLLGDNVIRGGSVLKPNEPNAEGASAFNALVAADARLEAIVLQQVGAKGHDGLLVARVK